MSDKQIDDLYDAMNATQETFYVFVDETKEALAAMQVMLAQKDSDIQMYQVKINEMRDEIQRLRTSLMKRLDEVAEDIDELSGKPYQTSDGQMAVMHSDKRIWDMSYGDAFVVERPTYPGGPIEPRYISYEDLFYRIRTDLKNAAEMK